MRDAEALTHLNTLKKPERFDHAIAVFSRVLVECLGARQSDTMLIISDTGVDGRLCAPLLSLACYKSARTLGIIPSIVLQQPKKISENASEEIVNTLKELNTPGIIITLLSNKLGELKGVTESYRKLLTIRKQRYATTPSLGFIPTENIGIVLDALDINYQALRQRHATLREKLMHSNTIKITTPAGTDFTITERGIPISSDGDYRTPGTGGNLPAGEVFLPVENCEGTIVVDGSVRCEERTILSQKTIITVSNGIAESITGGEAAAELRKTLDRAKQRADYPERVERIAEFGIGLNDHAILAGSTILDEKVLGTAHIAIGSNYWFGGKNKTIIHLDQVFKHPTVYVDGEKISW